MSLTVDIKKREQGAYVIAPVGRLDTLTHLEFEKQIAPYLTADTKALVLDMAQVNYISSAGLRVIFKAWKMMTAFKHSFVMTNLQPQIEQVFNIMSALPKEAVFADMAEVDAYLDRIQKQATGSQE
jgi:anti-anti-sigma factor